MKTAAGNAVLREPVSGPLPAGRDASGQLVLVRGDVLDSVGHVLGNLFQRMYHLVERARESDAVVAAELENSTNRLEEFLKLVLDYVSPTRLSLQQITAGDVVQSLTQQIVDATGAAATVAGLPEDGLRLLVDPGILARSFALIAAHLRTAARVPGPTVAVTRGGHEGPLVVTIRVPQARLHDRSSEIEMQWAVAERLIEIHGGVLRELAATTGSELAGEVTWEVSLPLQA